MLTHTQTSRALSIPPSTPESLKWDIHYLRLAFMIGLNLSKDPSTKVGAVVVTPDYRQHSAGFNGFPPKVLETESRWERPAKYQLVVHAETNALLNAPFDTKGCSLYATIPPCDRCWGQIIASGIKRVVTYATTRPETGAEDILNEMKTKVDYIVYKDDFVIDNISTLYF